MKVTHNTPELLIVEERPWLLGLSLIIGALIFAGIAVNSVWSGEPMGLMFFLGSGLFGLFFFIFVRRVQAVFHRTGSWLEIRRRSLRGYDKIRYELAEINQAIVETSTNNDGARTNRVTLVIPSGQSAGKHPLTQYYASGNGAQKAADAINTWLDSHRRAT